MILRKGWIPSIGLAIYALIGSPVPAQQTAELTPSRPVTTGERELARAKERIAELEARVAELESTLAAKNNKGDAKAGSGAAVGVNYDINPTDEEFRFLDLGVRKQYIAAERDRLIDQLHTNIPPLYEPAFSPLHGYTLPAHAFRVTIGNDRFINHHDFGSDKFYASFFDNVKVENQHVNLDLFYGLTSDDTIRVNVPFRSTNISGDGKAFRIQPMVMTMTGHGFGIGDVQVMAKHKWFDQAQKPFNLATVIGVQFPTGKNDARFNDAQTITMGGVAMPVSASSGGPRVDLFSDDLRIPNSAQPGTGSWGVIVGLMGTRQLTWNRFAGALHAGVVYKAMADNAQNVRPGNELTFAVSFVRPPVRNEHFTFDLTLFGRNKQSERFPGLIMHPEADSNGMPILNPDGTLKIFTTPRPPFEHGTALFLSPSIVILPKSTLRLSISPMYRLREPRRGPTPAVRLVFGIATTF